jgi:hypothetical protein
MVNEWLCKNIPPHHNSFIFLGITASIVLACTQHERANRKTLC